MMGILFVVMGTFLLLDRALLTLGNVMFLVGFCFLSGLQRTFRFFVDRKRLRGSILFLGGVALILIGWTFIGLGIEVFGFFNLFANFFPIALSWMRSMPYIGSLLSAPGIKQCLDKIANIKADPRESKAASGMWA